MDLNIFIDKANLYWNTHDGERTDVPGLAAYKVFSDHDDPDYIEIHDYLYSTFISDMDPKNIADLRDVLIANGFYIEYIMPKWDMYVRKADKVMIV